MEKNICLIRRAHDDIVEYLDEFDHFGIYITFSKSVYDKDNLRTKGSHQLFPCIIFLPLLDLFFGGFGRLPYGNIRGVRKSL